MAFDYGFLIAGGVIGYIIAIGYKKKTGRPISELWKNREQRTLPGIQKPDFQRFRVIKGIKQ